MKLTHSWLKDFLDIKISAKELAQRLTMAGLEVTSLKKKNRDSVYEIEVTPNRPDLLSVLGIAREVAAVTNSKLMVSEVEPSKFKIIKTTRHYPLEIKIQNKKDCSLYTAKIIKDVKVGPSPDWLKERLELVGIRPVNNIVDITNFVQLTMGQPLHAFDLDKLVSPLEIIIRRAKKGEQITTIDGIKRELNEDILIIASGINPRTKNEERRTNRPIAVAGVMGSKDTEVNENSKNILLESAKFNPLAVRRSRQRLGISSESSYRFERDIDISAVEPASRYALKLITDISKGKLSRAEKKGKIRKKRKKIILHIPDIKRILGLAIPTKEIKKILTRLNFKVKPVSKYNLVIQAPTFRKDISQPMDLVEEVARLWGYERIPPSLPKISPSLEGLKNAKVLKLVRQLLTSQGFNEVITYGLISKDILNKARLDLKEIIEIVNPLSVEHELLRPELLPSLLICLSRNISQQDAVLLFEIARVFKAKKERLQLGMVICGQRQIYTSAGKIKDELGLRHLKGVIELLFRNLGIKNYKLALEDKPYMRTNQAVSLKLNKEVIGYLGQIKNELSLNFDIKNKSVFAAELSLDKIFLLQI